MTRYQYVNVLQRALEGGAFAGIPLGSPDLSPEERWAAIHERAISIAGPPPDGLRLMPGWTWHKTPAGRRLGFALSDGVEERA